MQRNRGEPAVSEISTKRRWYRFSLRTLFLAILAIAIAYGWFVLRARQQQLAVATIRAAGAEVTYDYTENRVPQWLVNLLGVDFFHNVVTIHVYNNTDIKDADLEQLKKFPTLNCLYINRSSITDAGLEHLRGLTGLQFLYIDRTCVTDEGMKCLENLSQLNELNLSKTQITDAGLKQLKNLKQLQYLNLRDTNVTHRGVQELKQALPAVNIVR